MAAAAAAAPLVPPLPLPSLRRTRRMPAGSASPICPILRICRLHPSPFVSCTSQQGFIPPSHFKIHNLRTRSAGGYAAAEFAIPAGRSRLLSRAGFLEFRGEVCRRRGATAGAGPGPVGGNSGFFEYDWAKDEAVEGGDGGVKEFLMLVLKNLEARRQRIIQWALWLTVVTGAVTLSGVLASRFAVGRVFAAVVVAASFFGLLVEDEKLQLIGEGFEPVYVKASDQLHTLDEAISEVAHEDASCLSSIIPTLAGKFKGVNADNLSSGGSFVISPSSCKTDIRYEDPGLEGKPDVETVVTDISESIAHLSSMISTAGLFAAHPDSLSGIKSGIQDLCRELQAVEAALLDQQSAVEAQGSKPTAGVLSGNFVTSTAVEEELLIGSKLVECGISDDVEEIVPSLDHSNSDPIQQQRTSNQPLSEKDILVEETSKAPPFHQSITSLSTHLERIDETLEVPPSPSVTWPIPVIAGDEAIVDESLPSEVVETIPKKRPTIESIIGMGESSSKVDISHPVDLHEISPVTNSIVEEQSPISNHLGSIKHTQVMGAQRRRSRSPDPWQDDFTAQPTKQDELARGDWAASSGDLSSRKQTQVIETQRIRSKSPDPWQNDCTTRPIEQDVSARGDWAASSSHNWRNDEGSQVLDLFLIDHENSKTGTTRKDGIGNGRGVNTYGRVDFWGKNARSITKTSEQRGTLTKSKATGRGSSFGSMDDLEDDRPQEQGRRSLEEEQQQVLRRDLPSSSRAGQPWDGNYQPGAPGREALRDDQRMYRDADSSPAADDYRGVEADIRGPQVLRVDRDLEGTKNTPLVNMDKSADEGMLQPRYRTDARRDLVYPASVGGRAGPPGRTVSMRISNSGPSTTREGEGRRSTQSIDDARIATEGNYSGSKRVRDMPPNPEEMVYKGQESGPGNGQGTPDSLAYTPTQPEVMESNFALQQSKQAQTVKFQNYLDEAEALLEQGMLGLEGRIEVGVAERMLYEAADLLGKASEIYPENLIAVGQLGNTLLVHGQLKLKLSEQLRSMLPFPKASSPLMRGDAALAGREQESLELTLQEVCEECEELLVDAGRKFRTALSLDKTDVRALYNWGLALCYRGQLISEEGGERAMQDADKVYLAAIDKFEAMLGISQDYVSSALLNWGLAMRDRARLRDMGDKDRVQLLLQAKELFQDAVRLDPNNGQARGAVAVCSAELQEVQGFEAPQREDTMERPNKNWWQRRG